MKVCDKHQRYFKRKRKWKRWRPRHKNGQWKAGTFETWSEADKMTWLAGSGPPILHRQ